MNPNPIAEAQAAKTANIIEMALEFAGMTRVFSKQSTGKIIGTLARLFAEFASCVQDHQNYERLHAGFCDWCTENIWMAERTYEDGHIIASKKSSYGEAAKVLDICAKVYVYYCSQPSPEVAQALVPILHAALDNKMIARLARNFPAAGIKVTGLTQVDRLAYQKLQSLVAQEIQSDFHSVIHPVQYDDIIFRRLNRSDVVAAG
jgi:hypothetical protein